MRCRDEQTRMIWAAAHPRKELRILSEPGAVTIEAAADGAAGEDGKPKLPRFAMVAYTGGPMRIAGWKFPVIVELAGMAIPSQSRPVRFGHDAAAGVGHTEAIRVENGQVLAEGVISRDTPAAREIIVAARNGFPWQASIGAAVERFEFVKDGQSVQVNGRTFEGPVNVVRKATLGEISFVDLGADQQTTIRVAASARNGEQTMTFEQWLEAKGFAQADLDETQRASLQAMYEAEVAAANGRKADDGDGDGDGDDDSPAAKIRADATAEAKRIAAVTKACGRHQDILAKALEEGWDASRAELEVLRAERPAPPAAHVPNDSLDGRVLEAACMISGGLAADAAVQAYGEQTVEAAAKRFRGGIGLQELILEAAWANGWQGRSFRDVRGALRAAFAVQAAGLSTIDIPGILSNVANKFLLEGFFSVERVWREVCAVRNVSDFKAVMSYRLIGKDQYEIVAPGGEIKHGTLGEKKYTNKADTYGLLLAVDRRDIINDDLGAITTVPRKLGRGSGLKINDVFWTAFLNNSAFFTTANRNYISGATTVLSIDGLTAGEKAFMDQVDTDGKPIGIMPQILLVPTDLSAMAAMLTKSLEIRDTTASTKYPVANPHQGKFRPAVSRYLSNSAYTGYSATAWYLLADPNDLPVIEVAFLNGQESPTIETADADFDRLGIQMRGYHDFGVALQDPKGGLKSKGAA